MTKTLTFVIVLVMVKSLISEKSIELNKSHPEAGRAAEAVRKGMAEDSDGEKSESTINFAKPKSESKQARFSPARRAAIVGLTAITLAVGARGLEREAKEKEENFQLEQIEDDKARMDGTGQPPLADATPAITRQGDLPKNLETGG